MAEQQFDVFLCHNSEDKSAVIEIAQQLQKNGLKPWLDVWALQPGAIWQYALEQQIECIGAAAVFVGKQGLGPWQSEEIYAFLQEFLRRKCPVIPVMLHDAPQQPQLPIFLRSRHWVDFRLVEPDPLVQLIWGITGMKPQAPVGWAMPTTNPDQTSKEPKEAEFKRQREVEAEAQRQREAAERKQKQADFYNGGVYHLGKGNYEQAIADFQEAANLGHPDAEQKLAQAQRKQQAAQDDLRSEKGIDYTQLRDLLQAGKWREADFETKQTMIRAVGKKSGIRFTSEELLNFPCADLQTIDGLWVKYSEGKWGFSVQKRIYVECGAKLDGGDPGDKIWQEFCRRVGWLKDYGYVDYSSLTFDLQKAPIGQFPTASVEVVEDVGLDDWGVGSWDFVWKVAGFPSLAQRLDKL